jgi:hypothetical protein
VARLQDYLRRCPSRQRPWLLGCLWRIHRLRLWQRRWLLVGLIHRR